MVKRSSLVGPTKFMPENAICTAWSSTTPRCCRSVAEAMCRFFRTHHTEPFQFLLAGLPETQ